MNQTRTISVKSSTGKIVVGRLLRGTDLLTGLIELCRENNIRTAAITACVGSLQSAVVSWTAPSERTKRGTERTPKLTLNGPLELLSSQGLIGRADNDNPAYHLHGSLCDSNGRVWGAHLFQGGNPVHSTMDVVLIELPDVEWTRQYDEEIDLELPWPFLEKAD